MPICVYQCTSIKVGGGGGDLFVFCKNVFNIINRLYLDIALPPGYR